MKKERPWRKTSKQNLKICKLCILKRFNNCVQKLTIPNNFMVRTLSFCLQNLKANNHFLRLKRIEVLRLRLKHKQKSGFVRSKLNYRAIFITRVFNHTIISRFKINRQIAIFYLRSICIMQVSAAQKPLRDKPHIHRVLILIRSSVMKERITVLQLLIAALKNSMPKLKQKVLLF